MSDKSTIAILNALKVQMRSAGLLSEVGTSARLDHLIARLDTDEFLRLRTLPAFWALLAIWEVPIDGLDDDEPVNAITEEHEDDIADVPTAALNLVLDERPSSVAVKTYLLPHPLTPIDDVNLGKPYKKLILRLRRSTARVPGASGTITCLEDILNLSEDSLLKFEGVGSTYKEVWCQLKALYASTSGEFLPVQPVALAVNEPCQDVRDDMELNLKQLDTDELKAISKLDKALGKVDIRTILNFGTPKEKTIRSLGERTRSRLLQIRDRLIDELQRIAEGTLDYRSTISSLITSRTRSFESVAELGTFVLDWLDSYLSGLDEKSQLIFQYRWGFVDERMTLSEIGDKFGVSRERIRQMESKLNEQLNGGLALNADEIWEVAKKLPREELCLQMANLHACFPDQAHFYEFLAFVSYGRMPSLVSSTRLSLGMLDDYFAKHGTVIEQHEALQYLQQLLGGEENDAYNALHYLKTQGQVTITDGNVRPLSLGKHEAAAAVLSEHPNGLPWEDIHRLANQRGISSSPFSDRLSSNVLKDSPLMYLAGKGVYRHTRFVDFATIDEIAIFDAIHEYFASTASETSHLGEVHSGNSTLRIHDYYIVRYVVKIHGEAHGIYFNGKSQTDSISLNPEFNLYSQKSVILEAMRRKRTPMTKVEVAQLLKSRSLNHASVYINEMMLANQIVQVDRMLYTTPELAYENIDLGAMQHAIETVLRRHEKPVDPSVIQIELNMRQGEAYSKYFYGSLARYFSQLQHWHRRHNLFSLHPISFASVTEVIDLLCDTNTSMELNIAKLCQNIAITDEAAKISIYNWKAAKAKPDTDASTQEVEVELQDD